MVDGIKYEKINGSVYEMQLFQDEELEAYLYDVVSHSGAVPIDNKDKTIYDHVLVDSNVEYNFAKDLENREDIKFYFKLPSWFKIDTPLGGYNPDWAVIFEGDKKIYFVAETKGTNDPLDDSLSEAEKFKIKCGEKHFNVFGGVEYRAPVKEVQDLTKSQ